jgi:hypothetical protein
MEGTATAPNSYKEINGVFILDNKKTLAIDEQIENKESGITEFKK